MPRKRPLIGISAYELPASFSMWRDVPSVMIPAGYTRSVHAAGGIPLVLPPLPDAAELIELLDGIILSGGSDIAPAAYGQPAHRESAPVWPHRDEAELLLLEQALAADLPVLGICRGMQLLNVIAGGDLHQHLPDVLDDASPHKAAPGVWAHHEVATSPGSRLADIVGGGGSVHSCHHQAPDRIGGGLEVVATAPDGVVEGLERPDRRFAVGVLWHPEEDVEHGGPLFQALVAAA
jgi:putative glutamine amidotransferase